MELCRDHLDQYQHLQLKGVTISGSELFVRYDLSFRLHPSGSRLLRRVGYYVGYACILFAFIL